MKVAIVHDYLVNKGGAERVVQALHRIFPDAPIFTALYYPEATYESFKGADVRPSPWLRRLAPKEPESFRRLLPLFPRAFRTMKIEGFDAVISSSAGFAHGVRPAGGCHVVYCYTPPRFLWDPRYERSVAPLWARPLLPPTIRALRRWDRRVAMRPHFYVAMNRGGAERIRTVYGREAAIIHPPVETGKFHIAPTTGDYHLAVARLVAHKGLDIAIRAFNGMGRRLVVVGDGPMRADLERLAGPTIDFRGRVEEEELVGLFGRARALVVPGEEDFGIVPLEANASGRPVIAFRAGGALETVIDGVTGVHFAPATPSALAEAVERAESLAFDPMVLRTHAEAFGTEGFAARIRSFVERAAAGCLSCARARRTGRRVRAAAVGHRPEPVAVREEVY